MSGSTNRTALIRRFSRSALGFWQSHGAQTVRSLVAVLTAAVLLELWVQYRLNFWSRDFFNAVEQKSAAELHAQVLLFMPLAAASLFLKLFSVWARMTTEREWRRWLSNHLYDYWLRDKARFIQLATMPGDHQTPEYRIAEDARVATDLPVDLTLGLLSSLLSALVFIRVLWSAGDLEISVLGLTWSIHRYLVFAAISYSVVLTAATFAINGQLTSVSEQSKSAEADLRAAGAQLRTLGESDPASVSLINGRRAIDVALQEVVAQWRLLCLQMLRITFLSHANVLIAPSVGLLLCAPKYMTGTMSLGAVVQTSAAFVAVQTAFNWAADNYGRACEWASSASRIGSLLASLDTIDADDSETTKSQPLFSQVTASLTSAREHRAEGSRVADLEISARAECTLRGSNRGK